MDDLEQIKRGERKGLWTALIGSGLGVLLSLAVVAAL
jgi:hypothetical protein